MLFSLLTPWVVALSLVALLVALSYEGLAKEIPDLYCAALEACAVFLLCMQANVIARQIVLLRLLSPGGACALTQPHRPSLSLLTTCVLLFHPRRDAHGPGHRATHAVGALPVYEARLRLSRSDLATMAHAAPGLAPPPRRPLL